MKYLESIYIFYFWLIIRHSYLFSLVIGAFGSQALITTQIPVWYTGLTNCSLHKAQFLQMKLETGLETDSNGSFIIFSLLVWREGGSVQEMIKWLPV